MLSTFSQEQLKQMFAVCDLTTSQGQRDFNIMSILLATGIRVPELCKLRILDIHDTFIHVLDSKANREYDAAIRADVSEHLQKYITHYRKPAQSDDPYVFMSSKGQSLTPYNVGQLFQEIKKRAGITGAGLSVHSFRSTFNAQLLRSFKQS